MIETENQDILREEPKVEKLKGKKEDLDTDPCPVCQFDLSYNDKASQRIALLDGARVDGWMCPNCYSRFTLKDKLESLGDILEIGEA
mgnify:CR=1 FL=1